MSKRLLPFRSSHSASPFITLSKPAFFSLFACTVLSIALITLSPTFFRPPNHHLPENESSTILLSRPSTPPSAATPFPLGNTSILSTVKLGTWNIKFDPLSGHTVPVGDKGDGSEDPVGAVYDNAPVEGLLAGERPWAERRWRISDTIFFMGYEIIGLQEALHTQVVDLQALLGTSAWSWVGLGRDDGAEKGEYSPIFYDTSRFERLFWEVRWLSPTPTEPGSKGWDASQTRIVTLLTLMDKTTSAILHVGNTHFDDQGVQAREESGRLLRTLLPEYAKQVEKDLGKGDGVRLVGGVVLMGDLNSPPQEQGYQALTNTTLTSDPTNATPPFHDAMYLLPLRPSSSSSNTTTHLPLLPYGPFLTWTSFNPMPWTVQTRIDFIFLLGTSWLGGSAGQGSNGTKWTVGKYAVGSNVVEGDMRGWSGYTTDHRPVFAELLLV